MIGFKSIIHQGWHTAKTHGVSSAQERNPYPKRSTAWFEYLDGVRFFQLKKNWKGEDQ